MRTLFLVCLASSALWSQPQIPPKSPPVAEQKTAESTQRKKEASKHQEPTREPVPALKEAVTPPANQNAHTETNQELEVNRRLAEYTGQLATFTMWLVIAGALQFAALVVQAIVLRHHGKLIGRSVEQMKRAVQAYQEFVQASQGMLTLPRESNDITREVANAALAGAQAATTNANAAGESNTLTRESNTITRDATGLTRQSIVLTHRPKLTVRNIFVHGGIGALREGSTADGKVSIVNKGGMVAYVTEIFVTAKIYSSLPMKTLQDDGITGDQDTRRLNPGQPLTFPFKKEDGALAGGEIPALRSAGAGAMDQRRLYVLGFIKYTDDLDPPIARQTSFCRFLNPSTGRFEAVKDPDYEHAD